MGLAFFAFSLFGTVMTSCTFEQDDYFDESASLRITHINEVAINLRPYVN